MMIGRRVLLVVFCFTLAISAAAQKVAITVDDLPSHGALPPGTTRVEIARDIIQILKDAKAPSVYGFVNATKLEKNPEEIEVLKLWRAAGFPLGNHTYSHPDLHQMAAAEFEQNIAADEPTLKSLMGHKDWHYFRYPFLREGDTVEKRREVAAYLKSHGYKVAQVTLDFEDYLWNAPYARCLEKQDTKAIESLKASYLKTAAEYISLDQQMSQLIFGRDVNHVLLLHIGGFQREVLPQLLAMLKQRGFKFVSLDEAQKDPAYMTDPDAGSRWGGSLLDQIMDARKIKYPPVTKKPYKELEAICR
jgi:peptidoglycan/xylan/chitin deacetylase (PgdA/CDA1 family)